MISCGDKKTYNNYRSSLQFTSKNKYFINTINTDYIKQGSKSKMSLMSPTSYQTAPTRDKSDNNYYYARSIKKIKSLDALLSFVTIYTLSRNFIS